MARYDAQSIEDRLIRQWEEEGVYRFDPQRGPVYAIDTPPPTVSGYLHLGSVYSYSHADFMARFKRMRGHAVFYPMGFDDNGLPTERLVERDIGRTAEEVGRESFIAACLDLSERYEADYRALWQRLGLSIDWRYTYRTIDTEARAIAQNAFLDLIQKDLVYRRVAPTIWCPTCRTAIAQAEVDDLERESTFVTLAFGGPSGDPLPIATTRPELLPACVAVFVHPGDERYRSLVGRQVRVPLFGQEVPVLADEAADPQKGTGAVMCCTFGDTVDVEWWYRHQLPLVEALHRAGRMTDRTGPLAGMTVEEARRRVVEMLCDRGEVLGTSATRQSVRVHERCDTPVEYIVTPQWFVRLLDRREEFLRAGEAIRWWPEHMEARYRAWVEGVRWDWCISRQRYYGVPFPVWLCAECGAVLTPQRSDLPIDPTAASPPPCGCGGKAIPEADVMDTWFTSSSSPQIAARRLSDPDLYGTVFPMSLRPQAHEIIRTWAFYTIVMSLYRFGELPWSNVMISGWGLAPAGAAKISKSRGGGPMSPGEMLDRYSADALRYWAAGTGPGKDAVISEEKIAAGSKLVTKLWNVGVLAARFAPPSRAPEGFTPADRWVLSRLQETVAGATAAFESYEYATARALTEGYFWRDLADNYLEMAKGRLYDAEDAGHAAAAWTLHTCLDTVLTLFAPILPFVSDAVYGGVLGHGESIHRRCWPEVDARFIDAAAQRAGEALVAVATEVRRWKSDRGLSLGAPIERLMVRCGDPELAPALEAAEADIRSVTRAQTVEITGGHALEVEIA